MSLADPCEPRTARLSDIRVSSDRRWFEGDNVLAHRNRFITPSPYSCWLLRESSTDQRVCVVTGVAASIRARWSARRQRRAPSLSGALRLVGPSASLPSADLAIGVLLRLPRGLDGSGPTRLSSAWHQSPRRPPRTVLSDARRQERSLAYPCPSPRPRSGKHLDGKADCGPTCPWPVADVDT